MNAQSLRLDLFDPMWVPLAALSLFLLLCVGVTMLVEAAGRGMGGESTPTFV